MRRCLTSAAALALIFAALSGAASSAHAQRGQTAGSAASLAGDLGWPRDFDIGSDQLEVYQPQIETWQGDRMSGRMAIAVGPKSGSPIYGVAHFSARAAVDKTAGTVTLGSITISKVDVPTAPDQAGRLQSVLQQQIPATGITTALDHLQASYAVSQQIAKDQTVPVRNDPPRIVFAAQATVLVPVDGDPVLATLQNAPGFQRVINTRALFLQDQAGTMYINAAGFWYEARAAAGPWLVLASPPGALLSAAQAASAIAAPDPLLPADGKAAQSAPALLVATQPTELVLTSGQPQIAPVDGTSLLTMTNADHAVFIVAATNDYYVLVSGRWFKASNMTGPWTYVPGNALPPDFAKISVHDPKANVLVSVPGTPQAKEAAIAATIPQTATVSRSKASLTVSYAGGPKFEPIQGTGLTYAVNTPTPVIESGRERYYAVSEGIWFVANNPLGPWRVADAVPEAIYTIPATSPLHYVTYVRVYSSTPEEVVVGYTPGYMGLAVDPTGVVVYGTGYYYPPYIGGGYWYGYPATYGYGAGFALSAAEGFAFGFATGRAWGAASPYWGPFWGYRGGYVNWQHVNINQVNVYGRWGEGTITHVSGWNSWSGEHWSGTHVSGFDPYGGNRFHGDRSGEFSWHSGGYTASRDSSFSSVSRGYESTTRTSTDVTNRSNVDSSRTLQSNRDATFQADRNTSLDRDAGSSWNNGRLYSDHDGNVYQHTDDGWQRRTQDGWQRTEDQRTTDDLDRERSSRDTGDRRVDDSDRRGAFDEDRFGERADRGERFGGRAGGRRR
jgi:hypothetical protein